jgi:hypothetical protein
MQAVLQLRSGRRSARLQRMIRSQVRRAFSRVSGFSDTMRDRLRAYGLFGEIISWKLRMFVPADREGAGVLAKVLESYPVERFGEREAA